MHKNRLVSNKNTGYGNVWLFGDVTKSVFTLIESTEEITPNQFNMENQGAHCKFLEEYG